MRVTITEFLDQFISAIKTEHQETLIFMSCSVTGFDKQPERTDIFLIIGAQKDLLRSEFLTIFIKNDVSDKQQISVLQFLLQEGKSDPTRYPLFVELSTNTGGASPSIHVCNLFVAPAFQQKGIIKRVFLNLLNQIKIKHPELSFTVGAFTIHPASYRLLNPHDKELKHFDSRSYEDRSLESLLLEHQRCDANSTPRFFGVKQSPNTFCGLAPGFLLKQHPK